MMRNVGLVALFVLGCGDGGSSAIDGGTSVDASLPTADGGPAADVPVVWFSDWRHALGTSRDALYDGDRWTGQLCAADVAEVVDAAGLGFPTPHVYRADYRNPGDCLMVQVTDRWSPPRAGQYFFVRVYYRNAIPDGEVLGFPHPLHIGRSAVPTATYATWVNFVAPAGGVSPMTLQLGGGPEWPDRFWGFGFRTNETYRLELRIHRREETRAAIDLRVYDGRGDLVAEDDDWGNGESGSNFRSLATSDPTFPVDDASFTLLEIGNNDPAMIEPGTGRYVYFGAVAVVVSDDPNDWPGPYPTAAEAAP
jgi:hypothetical protein